MQLKPGGPTLGTLKATRQAVRLARSVLYGQPREVNDPTKCRGCGRWLTDDVPVNAGGSLVCPRCGVLSELRVNRINNACPAAPRPALRRQRLDGPFVYWLLRRRPAAAWQLTKPWLIPLILAVVFWAAFMLGIWLLNR